MPDDLTCVRVFIASPGGLEEERNAFREELEEFNATVANPEGFHFKAVGFEDTIGGHRRAQEIINEEVRSCDFFLMLLWGRWGTPPGSDDGMPQFSSGTEEEYNVALECFQTTPQQIREILILFKSVPKHQIADPGEQLQKVLSFREAIENENTCLYIQFDEVSSFRKQLRRHFNAWLRELRGCGVPKPSRRASPSEDNDSIRLEDSHTHTATQGAQDLACKGLLTEAERAFAEIVVEKPDPLSLFEFAKFLASTGRKSQARIILEEAIRLSEVGSPTFETAQCYSELGTLCRSQNDFDGAIDAHTKALDIGTQLDNPAVSFVAYSNLANIYGLIGQPSKADRHYQLALDFEDRLSPCKAVANTKMNIGRLKFRNGNPKEAEAFFSEALEVNKEIGDLLGCAKVYGNIGSLRELQGDLDAAAKMHQESLKISLKIGNLHEAATQYGNLGIIGIRHGDRENAKKLFRTALHHFEQLGDLEGIANQNCNLAGILIEENQLEAAEKSFLLALGIYREQRSNLGIGACKQNLAIIRKNEEKYDEAEKLFREVIEIGDTHNELEVLVMGLSSLGELLRLQGELKKARAYFSQALNSAQKLGATPLILQIQESLASLDGMPE